METLQELDDIGEEEEEEEIDVVGLRVVKKSKDAHMRSVSFITKHFMENIPNSTEDDKLILPVTKQNLELFFKAMSKPKANGTVKSKSTMTGYISAIKWYYSEHNLEMSKECEIYLTKFSAGYKRLVAQKRSSGVMKTFEGKGPLGFSCIVL